MRSGLAVSAIAVLGLIVVDTEMGGHHKHLLTNALFCGAALFGAGLLLGALVKIANHRIGRRCPRCHQSVRRGHVYCEDHFQESVYNSRDLIVERRTTRTGRR